MAILGANVRELYKSLGPVGFSKHFDRILGLRNEKGERNVATIDNSYKPVLEGQQISPDSIDIKELTIGLLGVDAHDPSDYMRRARFNCKPTGEVLESDGSIHPDFQYGMSMSGAGNVMEAGGTEMVPSQFPNISTYNTAILGLLEAKVLESYNRPQYMADKLFELDSTRRRSERWGGVSLPGDSAEERKPGEPHKRIQLSERYVTTRDTKNFGMGIDVTFEAEFFDYFKQLMTQADKLGETLALKKEKRCLSTFLGATDTYTYDGTTYATYATSGNWINKVASNALADFTNVNTALQLFTAMTDQETGQSIEVLPKDIMVMPSYWMTMNTVLFPNEVMRANPGNTTSFPSTITNSKNPLSGVFNPTPVGGPTWPYLYNLAQAAASGDAPGLALSAANAAKYWWIGDFKKAFKYVQNLPMTVTRAANAASYEMLDRRLVLSIFADEMGTAEVYDPRYVVLSTG